ncbi:MAG: hypothetical protein V3S13_01625 [Candidatus Omnitrophota bacterium]
MRSKDRLFIFLSIVLIILFIASLLEQMSISTLSGRRLRPQAEDISGILIKLEEANIEPQEAKYYRVIND